MNASVNTIQADHRELLKTISSRFPHRLAEQLLTLDEWESQDRPHDWQLVESKEITATRQIVYVYFDTGHGLLATIYEGRILWTKKNCILTHKDYVVLDISYYNIHKYIWE